MIDFLSAGKVSIYWVNFIHFVFFLVLEGWMGVLTCYLVKESTHSEVNSVNIYKVLCTC